MGSVVEAEKFRQKKELFLWVLVCHAEALILNKSSKTASANVSIIISGDGFGDSGTLGQQVRCSV
jgi:hypothetical protein